MPFAHGNDDLDSYVQAETVQNGFWANTRDYMVSLLTAWWGDAATAGNDFCYGYLPRLTGSHSTYDTVLAQLAGDCAGYFLFGQNPAVGSANARMQRMGMANLDWLVVRDLVLIESATWWQDGPEIETGEMRTQDIGTEVFFLPAAAHTEKDVSFTNTQRMPGRAGPAGRLRTDPVRDLRGRPGQHARPGLHRRAAARAPARQHGQVSRGARGGGHGPLDQRKWSPVRAGPAGACHGRGVPPLPKLGAAIHNDLHFTLS
jgi:hypothetical protein